MARLPFNRERVEDLARAAAGPAGGRDAPPTPAPAPAPLTVAQAAELIKTALADHLPGRVRVVGEVSNFSDRTHWFFSLKDERATLRCVCFASTARRVRCPVRDGMQVVAAGRIDFYDTQGKVQLYVDRIEPVGQGALELRLRELMAQLRELGYFAQEHKKPLPMAPRRVAVITSRSAAALQDVTHTARRRWPGCRLHLYDVRVQGAAAAGEIAAALEALSRDGGRRGLEAIVLTRGGGSIEDLWAFNERLVADAIYRCPLPIVAAIGHETDTTIAELVADMRCATPTQAAMQLVPDQAALMHQVHQLDRRLSLLVRRQVEHGRHRLDAAARHALFRRPGRLVEQARREVDAAEKRLRLALPRRLQPARERLARMQARLQAALPRRTAPAREGLATLTDRLHAAARRRRRTAGEKLESLNRRLESVNPHSVLKRGYSYTLGPRGDVLRTAGQVRPGETITSVLHDGRVRSVVEGEQENTTPPRTHQASPPRAGACETRPPRPTDRGGRSARRRGRASDVSQNSLFDDDAS